MAPSKASSIRIDPPFTRAQSTRSSKAKDIDWVMIFPKLVCTLRMGVSLPSKGVLAV